MSTNINYPVKVNTRLSITSNTPSVFIFSGLRTNYSQNFALIIYEVHFEDSRFFSKRFRKFLNDRPRPSPHCHAKKRDFKIDESLALTKFRV